MNAQLYDHERVERDCPWCHCGEDDCPTPRAKCAECNQDPDVDWYMSYAIVKDPNYFAKRVIYRVNHCGACDAVVWTILDDPERNLYNSWAGAWEDIKKGTIDWASPSPTHLPEAAPPSGC